MASDQDTAASVCEYLEWDSRLFGFPVARLNARRLDPRLLEDVRAWLGRNRIKCLYFLAESGDAETVLLAAQNGFRFADIRISLETELHSPPEFPPDLPVRLSREHDVAALREIAQISHRDSRFYFDGRFPPEACDELYRLWIDKSCHGYADAVWVAEADARPVGYLSCHLKDGDGSIGLVAVHPAYQGLHFGRHLAAAARRWFYDHGATRIRVVTQGRNIAAQRLYQRCGFLTSSVEIWYHLWPAAPGAETR